MAAQLNHMLTLMLLHVCIMFFPKHLIVPIIIFWLIYVFALNHLNLCVFTYDKFQVNHWRGLLNDIWCTWISWTLRHWIDLIKIFFLHDNNVITNHVCSLFYFHHFKWIFFLCLCFFFKPISSPFPFPLPVRMWSHCIYVYI